MPARAVLDANVLHPMVLCDLFMRLAQNGAYTPLWSRPILDEMVRSVHRRRPDLDRAFLERRAWMMNLAAPGAEIAGVEALAGTLADAFGGDGHVVAAAIIGQADVIVTFNLRDFPHALLSEHGIDAQPPDDFLCELWRVGKKRVRQALDEQAQGTRKPHLKVADILERLSVMVPRFAGLLRQEA